jgi:aryl-alcohol dehydrogenase-like predicted oxidoreductase
MTRSGLDRTAWHRAKRCRRQSIICGKENVMRKTSRSVTLCIPAIFPRLAELDTAVTAYGVLSRGLLSGSKPAGAGDLRSHLPRFSGENGERNRVLVDALAGVAEGKGGTAAQLAIAWVRAKGAAQHVTIVPTLGARTRHQLNEALAALELALTPAELAALEATVPASAVAGTRYPAQMMAQLDSER